MATKDEKNTSELATFSSLKDHERRAVILKSQGKTGEQITNHINDMYALTYAIETVKAWFFAGGKLEQAYAEYNEAQALIALKEARQLIKKASTAAAANMIQKMKSSDDAVSLRASAMLLNKYIPDKQVVLDKAEAESDLPEELMAAAAAFKEADDESQGVDEPPVGGTDPAEAGQ